MFRTIRSKSPDGTGTHPHDVGVGSCSWWSRTSLEQTRFQPRVSINHVENAGHDELYDNRSYDSGDDDLYSKVRQDFEDDTPSSGDGR